MKIYAKSRRLSRQMIDAIYSENEDPVKKLRAEFEPQGIKVLCYFSGQRPGIKSNCYMKCGTCFQNIDSTPIVFEQEYFPETAMYSNEPYTVEYDEEKEEYVVEGPRIEKMLGYTNIESEKGFLFFQRFLKEQGILGELEKLGIQEGDTVRMYGLSFDYYK